MAYAARHLFPLLASLMVTGCTVAGPDYHRPESAVSERPAARGLFKGGNKPAFSATSAPDGWRRLYNDPLLDRLIKEALAANTDLRIAEATIARAEAQQAIAEDARLPRTIITAGVERFRPSAQEALMPEADFPSFWGYALNGGISYQVDLAGQIRRAIEAGAANLAATRAAYEATRITVVAQTAAAYAEACAAGHEITILQSQVTLQEKSSELTRRLFRAGRSNSVEINRSAAQEAQVRAELPILAGKRQAALFRLATLTGKPPAEYDPAVARCNKEPRLQTPIPIGDGAALLRRRPDIRSAEFALHAMTARIGIAEADLYPKIRLGASVGSVGLVEDFLSSATNKFSLGPLLSWEWPNRKRVRANIAVAQAGADAAFARFDDAVLNALRETETALTLYAHGLARERELQRTLDEATAAANKSDRLFRAGRQGYLSVLDAQRTRADAAQALAAQQAQIAADQIRLFLALGGGWQDQKTADAGTAAN